MIMDCTTCHTPVFKVPPLPDISFIPAILATNTAPKSHEEHFIRKAIDTSKLALSQIDQIIVKVKQTLEFITLHREECSRRTELYQHALSKARFLPDEVLSEIFLHAVADQAKGMAPLTYDMQHMILKVCKRWHAVALASPRIWAVLPCIGINNTGSQSMEMIFHRLEKALKLSRSVPLRVCFKSLTSQTDPIVKTLLPYSDRFDHLEVNGFLFSLHDLALQISGNLALLKSIRILLWADSWRDEKELSLPLSPFLDAPSLAK
ncbi:hypothetical protein NLJ89_g6008 [Agrocybe chaxingu]|uniref:F-box domain-containing protein n=1 Tax=Agrocybe chaxingu TaxID=84603 RepID=A0A9W8K011_9AGAR|nr:hypothetical protein NLJ89_g6008 [Agrocybe chaxingu]